MVSKGLKIPVYGGSTPSRATLFLAAVAALLVGCAASPASRVLAVDAAFTVEERAALERCVARWDAVAPESGLALDFDAPVGDTSSIVKRGGGNMGDTIIKRAHVTLHPNLTERGVFESVACHELGHVLGLDHVEELAVMNPGPMWEVELSAADVGECVRVGACSGTVRP